MLTAAGPIAPTAPAAVVGCRPVRVEVSSVVVRLALLYVAEDAGWATCADTAACHCLRVSDQRPRRPGEIDVLVAKDEPAACQDAIDAALLGLVGAVVLWNEPEGLVAACQGLEGGLTTIPKRVIELAGLAPRLSERLRETLRLLAMGRSSIKIAAALHQSESTAKRDIADLLRLFDAPNRAALVSAASSLGFIRAPLVAGLHTQAS